MSQLENRIADKVRETPWGWFAALMFHNAIKYGPKIARELLRRKRR